MPVTVATTAGELLADFDGLQIALDSGDIVSYETVDRVAEEYWDEWAARNKKV